MEAQIQQLFTNNQAMKEQMNTLKDAMQALLPRLPPMAQKSSSLEHHEQRDPPLRPCICLKFRLQIHPPWCILNHIRQTHSALLFLPLLIHMVPCSKHHPFQAHASRPIVAIILLYAVSTSKRFVATSSYWPTSFYTGLDMRRPL